MDCEGITRLSKSSLPDCGERPRARRLTAVASRRDRGQHRHRVRADYHAVWKKRIDAQFKTSLSVPGHHITWILGVDSLDAALKKLEPYRLDGVVQKMRCPFLLVHGEDDEQIPMADAHTLYNACGSRDKTLRVYTAEEGGAQHCQRDYLTLVVADMWDWFEDKLVRA
jgi:hypothetical protein